MLALTGTPHELRNVAVVLPLTSDGPEFGRSYCRYSIGIRVSSGAVGILTILPQFTLTQTGLILNCDFNGAVDVQVNWEFGDSTAIAQRPTAQHSYLRPGRCTLLTRLSKNGMLVEYRSIIVVSTSNATVTPLVVAPVFTAAAAAADGTVAVTVSLPTGLADVSLDCANYRPTSKVVATRFWCFAPVAFEFDPGSQGLTGNIAGNILFLDADICPGHGCTCGSLP
jgi:hypothetical protein